MQSRNGEQLERLGKSATQSKAVLSAEEIWKYYSRGPLQSAQGPLGLADVSLELRTGELVCITGPSGQGKTTLLRILALDDHPSRGRLYVLGRDTANMTQTERDDVRSEAIHYVPQLHLGLLPRTAVDTVAYWLVRLDGIGQAEAEERAFTALESVGLPLNRFHQRVDKGLSGGEKARVALAAAFARQRPICLADELFASLDIDSAVPLVELFRGLCKRGAAVAIIVHQPELRPYFDRVVLIDEKHIASDTRQEPKRLLIAAGSPPAGKRDSASMSVRCGRCGRIESAMELYCRHCLLPLLGTQRCPCGEITLPVGALFCVEAGCGRRLSPPNGGSLA